MSRQWVKLHTDMLSHPGTGRLTDGAFRAWVTMLLMAGRLDEDGRIGSVADVAWQLHWQPQDVAEALMELNGRVALTGDDLAIRDWHEWQAERDTSAAARMARFRERQRNGNGPVTSPPTEQLRNVTSPELELELELELEKETTTLRVVPPPAKPNGRKPAIAAPDKPVREDQAIFEAVCQWLSLTTDTMTAQQRGKINAWCAGWRKDGATAATVRTARGLYLATFKGSKGSGPSKGDLELHMSQAMGGSTAASAAAQREARQRDVDGPYAAYVQT